MVRSIAIVLMGLLVVSRTEHSQAFLQAPSGSARSHRPASTQLHAISIKRVTNDFEVQRVSSFFIDNFWTNRPANDKQRSQLEYEVYRDLLERYVDPPSNRPKQVRGVLLEAKDGMRILGSVGLETRTIKNNKISKYGYSDLGGKDVILRPVLANLAVDKSARRQGVGKKLMDACEKVASEWGYDELWLLVDEQNLPARKLYEKLGYETVFKDREGTKVVLTEWQIRDMPTTNLAMKKVVMQPAPTPLSFLWGFLRGST